MSLIWLFSVHQVICFACWVKGIIHKLFHYQHFFIRALLHAQKLWGGLVGWGGVVAHVLDQELLVLTNGLWTSD